VPAHGSRRLRALDAVPGPAFLDALDEAWAAGDAVLPMAPDAGRAESLRVLEAARVDESVDDGDALVLATSGSTAAKKAVVLGHAALTASAEAAMVRLGLDPNDAWLSCLPWHHIAGLQVALRARHWRIPLVVHERFDVRRIAEERQATLVSLVPTQLVRLLDSDVDLARFRVVLLGGAPASAGLLARASRAGVPVVTTYGMTETCGGCVYDGVPLDGVDADLEPDGRIRLRGPVLMSGYRLRPELTAEALATGWFRTSDLGHMEGDRLVIDGRVDDVINTGGVKVAANAVAAAIAEHPDVHDVVVLGVPDQEWGQRVVAFVVTNVGRDLLAELRTWVADRLGSSAAPRAVFAAAELPMLASGKPDRAALLALADPGR
jgi:O-succinylbenzoic acid--CoA ligase